MIESEGHEVEESERTTNPDLDECRCPEKSGSGADYAADY